MPRITRFEQRRFWRRGTPNTKVVLSRQHRRIPPADTPTPPQASASRRGLDWPTVPTGLNPHGPALLALGARWDRVYRRWHVPPHRLADALSLIGSR